MSVNTVGIIFLMIGFILLIIAGLIELARDPRVLERYLSRLSLGTKRLPHLHQGGGIDIFAPRVRIFAIPALILMACGTVLFLYPT